MKPLYSILFLLVLIFNIVGINLLVEIERYSIRSGVEKWLASSTDVSATQVLKLSLNDYHSLLTGEDEIQFRGKMFDVAKEVVERDSVTLYCINDEEEDTLFDELEKFYNPQKEDTPDRQNQHSAEFVKFLSLTFLQQETLSCAVLASHPFSFQQLSLSFPEGCSSLDSPPPKS